MSDRILVSTRKGLFILERGSRHWAIVRTAFVGTPVTAALHSKFDGALYAALQYGHFGPKFHRSEDFGRSWQELPAPAFPAGVPDAPALHLIWSLEEAGPPHQGRLWAGGIPAGLFRSDTRGESWEFIQSLWNVPERAKWFGGGYDDAGIDSILPNPDDSNRALVAISCGGVWATHDDARHWELGGRGLFANYVPPENAHAGEIQDPHRIARCLAHPSVLWMQHHNGVFRSTDEGRNWTQLSPPVADFGFAVAAHPLEKDVAWFVPAISDELRVPRDGRLCVTRTEDGGATWQVLRNGLPETDAYDLVYRHGLDVDAEGVRLAMGSTTGSLWVSEDRGERWQLVNAHLPPIYAVRFF
jgi:hypothetical protein